MYGSHNLGTAIRLLVNQPLIELNKSNKQTYIFTPVHKTIFFSKIKIFFLIDIFNCITKQNVSIINYNN